MPSEAYNRLAAETDPVHERLEDGALVVHDGINYVVVGKQFTQFVLGGDWASGSTRTEAIANYRRGHPLPEKSGPL